MSGTITMTGEECDALHAEAEALRAENARLRQQVGTLQSDANSWQSGYDKGREDGAKGWKAQHARDSAELRRLCAERDHLKACQENAQLHITGLVAERNAALWQRDTLRQQLAERDAEIMEQARCNGMGSEREARLIAQRDKLAGLLRHASSALGIQGWDALTHEIDTALSELTP